MQEWRLEDRHPVDRAQPLRIVPHPPELRLAVAVDLAEPSQVIQAEVVEIAALGVEAERVGHFFKQLRRRVADADHTARDGAHRLRDHACRVGEVDDPRRRREPADLARVTHHVRDGARRHGEPRGAHGLLADDAVALGSGLVPDPAVHAAYPDAGENEVGSADAFGKRLAEDHAAPGRHQRRDAADGRQAFLVDVVERDLINRQIRVRQPVDEQRRAHTGTADDGDLHGRSFFTAARCGAAGPQRRRRPASIARRRNCRGGGSRAVSGRRAGRRESRR